MATTKRYTVARVEGLNPSDRRAVAFLSCDGSTDINGRAVFGKMNGTPFNNVRNRFDHWIGCHVHDKWHHGWPGHSRYGACYCFRWYEDEARHRFYGFKFNPTPRSNPRFQVCVLVSHARKFTEDTDPNELERVVTLMADVLVIAAIKKEFPDSMKGAHKWN